MWMWFFFFGVSNMKIASWNVNSINIRKDHVREWLKINQPDFLFLQELKCETNKFPHEAFEGTGYDAIVHGQKSYNGVALLTNKKDIEISKVLPGDSEDIQA